MPVPSRYYDRFFFSFVLLVDEFYNLILSCSMDFRVSEFDLDFDVFVNIFKLLEI